MRTLIWPLTGLFLALGAGVWANPPAGIEAVVPPNHTLVIHHKGPGEIILSGNFQSHSQTAIVSIPDFPEELVHLTTRLFQGVVGIRINTAKKASTPEPVTLLTEAPQNHSDITMVPDGSSELTQIKTTLLNETAEKIQARTPDPPYIVIQLPATAKHVVLDTRGPIHVNDSAWNGMGQKRIEHRTETGELIPLSRQVECHEAVSHLGRR